MADHSDQRSLWLRPQTLRLVLLGFAAGTPFLAVFGTFSAWTRELGLERSSIGMLSWVGIAFSVKFLWAPLVDRSPLPMLGRLGQRRSWLLLAQVGVMIGLLGMAGLTETNLALAAAMALLVAVAAATQDIALDAYRIEIAPVEHQGVLAAAYITGYRIGLLASGAGVLYAAEYLSWASAYSLLALCMMVGVVTVLFSPEPERTDPAGAMSGFSLHKAIIEPFRAFFARYGWHALGILLFIALFRFSDIVMGVMANPLYIDLGYSKLDIANITKFFGLLMTLLGAALGGVLVARAGFVRPLLLVAVLVASTNLLYVWLASSPMDKTLLTAVISCDNLAGGMSASVFIAYLSSLVDQRYTATQYALFSSLMTLPGKLTGGFSGFAVDAWGYPLFFGFAALLGIPAILLVLWLARYRNPDTRGRLRARNNAPDP